MKKTVEEIIAAEKAVLDPVMPNEEKVEFTAVKDDGSKAFKEQKASKKSTKFGTVQGAGFINVRNGAGADHDVVTILKEGTEVKIVAEEGDWYQIAFKNNAVIGHIMKQYVSTAEG